MTVTVYSHSPAKPYPVIAYYAADAAQAQDWIARQKLDVLNRRKTYTIKAD